MKKLLSMLFALVLSSAFVQAQTTQETTTKAKAKGSMSANPQMQNPAMKDGIMMQGGKLMMVNKGVAAVITEDQTLSNGMVVMKDGNVKKADGTTMMLHEGDHLTMDGKIMHHHPNMQADGKAKKGKGKIKVDDDETKTKGSMGNSKTKY
ncbi:hypothetical protein I5M27_13695 [Adhaeribacter sp. BT258]|uniref:DUF6799 domain-containing protein n=1 Tax=Adhaeribacter terrigena TaxID=2793070 RepID=A0ABS1C5V1_9BACT|nr:DUF6799 domain-containing protein [Adhaeribacter terrigena]MBK0404043.1 hypothetical protein [Adhaeribacter terrigena]